MTDEAVMDEDRYGLPLSTTSTAAATLYRDGVDLLLSAWPGAAERFEAAIEADPDFALAHIARGRVHQAYAEAAAAREKSRLATELSNRCTAREKGHIAALAASIEGRSPDAIKLAEAHLELYPRDAVVLSLLMGAFGLYAFSGRADHDQARLGLCERHARHYGRDWWFLTYLGWSHTEAGNAGAGRLLAEQALDLRPANGNGAHALAHALFEQGELDVCQAFMDGWLPAYDRSGILHGHLSWHSALGALDRGDTATALRVYEERIRIGNSQAAPLNAFTDIASLLWRCELSGGIVPAGAWSEVANYAASHFPRPGPVFADLHYALIAARTGQPDVARERLAEIERSATPATTVVTGLTRGMLAFVEQDYRAAIAALEAVQAETVRIGGSHAQRELVEDTLIAACLRAGLPEKARALIDLRLHRRPSRRDAAWRAQTTAA